MLGYLILVALQFAIAFLCAPFLLAKIPITGDPKTFVHAAIYALIVWVVGLVGSFALKDVRTPGTSTLVSALVGGLIGAGLMLVPAAMQTLQSIVKFPPLYLPLGLAIVGYLLRR
jgi:hypothetical protein